MAIDEIRRLPASYDSTHVANQDLQKSAGKDAGKQVAESANPKTSDQITQSKAEQTDAFNNRAPQPEPSAIDTAIGKLQDYVQKLDRELQFSVDSDTGRTVVKILDARTQEVVRQIPSEELVELSKSLEKTRGILFRSEV